MYEEDSHFAKMLTTITDAMELQYIMAVKKYLVGSGCDFWYPY